MAASFCRPQPAATRPGSSASSVRIRAGASSARRLGRVDTDRGTPSDCAPASATCARGRRTRSRGRRSRSARSRARRRQAQAQREVDVLVVEEEALREAAQLLPARRGIARQAPESAATSRGRGRRRRSAGRVPGPDDAGEVDGVAGRVDRRARRRRRQRLPGHPATLLHPGTPDRLAEARSRRRVRIEDDEQVPPRLGGAQIAAGGEAGVAAAAHHPRGRRQRRHGIRGPVSGVVVDDDQLVPLPQLGQQRGQGPQQLLAAVPGNDQDRKRRAHRRGRLEVALAAPISGVCPCACRRRCAAAGACSASCRSAL